MNALLDQLQAFAKAHGGTVRTGPQPRKPITETPPSIGALSQSKGSQSVTRG